METTIKATLLGGGRVLINGHVYKKLKTEDGKYTKDERRQYMKAWRQERKRKVDIFNQI